MTISINTNNVAASQLDLVNPVGQTSAAPAHKHGHGAHKADADYLLWESLQAQLSGTVEASGSTVSDLDGATSLAQLTKTQLLQQGGSSFLAQANTSPDAVAGILN